jgi:uncharacterized membrane protein YhfC
MISINSNSVAILFKNDNKIRPKNQFLAIGSRYFYVPLRSGVHSSPSFWLICAPNFKRNSIACLLFAQIALIEITVKNKKKIFLGWTCNLYELDNRQCEYFFCWKLHFLN